MSNVTCPYCAAQGIKMEAVQQKQEALDPNNIRVGCDNGHLFAIPKKDVK